MLPVLLTLVVHSAQASTIEIRVKMSNLNMVQLICEKEEVAWYVAANFGKAFAGTYRVTFDKNVTVELALQSRQEGDKPKLFPYIGYNEVQNGRVLLNKKQVEDWITKESKRFDIGKNVEYCNYQDAEFHSALFRVMSALQKDYYVMEGLGCTSTIRLDRATPDYVLSLLALHSGSSWLKLPGGRDAFIDSRYIPEIQGVGYELVPVIRKD